MKSHQNMRCKRRPIFTWLLFITIFIGSSGWSEAAIQCYECHGTKQTGQEDIRPVDAAYRNVSTGGFQGNHRSHIAPKPDKSACAKCHQDIGNHISSHRDGKIDLVFNINSSPHPAKAQYNNGVYHNQTSVPTLGKCTNVNCHFESSTDPESKTPLWGSSAVIGCNGCHGIPPADGSHPSANPLASGKKHGDYYNTDKNSCAKCHVDHDAENPKYGHVSDTGKRALILFSTAQGKTGKYSGDVSYPKYLPSQHASPSTRNGSCTELYCHSDGKGGAALITPVWGGASLTCKSCHDGSTNLTQLGGNHEGHINLSSYAFACEKCHKDTVTGSDTIRDRSLHVDKVKTVGIKDGGTYDPGTKACNNTYCHSDALGRFPLVPKWTDTAEYKCFSCHKGTKFDNTSSNCRTYGGTWVNSKPADPLNGVMVCSPYINMTSNGHGRLAGPQWIRKYACSYCHNATVDAAGVIIDKTKHVNNVKDVEINPYWSIDGMPNDPPHYDPDTKTCYNTYCHSDGTTNPEELKAYSWTQGKTECNTCHGHPIGACVSCHDGVTVFGATSSASGKKPGRILSVQTAWPVGQEWKSAIPMFPNTGPNTARANSHPRHTETTFTCDECHSNTIVFNGECSACHLNGTAGQMSEVTHINADYHVNKIRDVSFKRGGTYNKDKTILNPNNIKTCSGTACHTNGEDPAWGGSINEGIVCLSCHGTTGADVDSFGFFDPASPTFTKTQINTTEWVTAGHGRPASAGPYPFSNNPPANFPGNPCWYCHDNSILHKDASNPFRLRQHSQFSKRFDKECVYCHMSGKDPECISCHDNTESLAPQLNGIFQSYTAKWPNGATVTRDDHSVWANNTARPSCLTIDCHYVNPDNSTEDMKLHNEGAGFWNMTTQADIRNQYMMMGVCLQCHDDDSGNKCASCHVPTGKYSLGFDPGTGFIKPVKARASSVHFGYKHSRAYKLNGKWKGGKFCWDCHDPHGDSNIVNNRREDNIFMIQNKVATETDGKFGIPLSRATVVFRAKNSGSDYVKTTGTIDGICNVCHSAGSQHFRSDGGDSHNISTVCTKCHEHRFSDSHGDKKPCVTCHNNKPVPRHSGFGLPRDCVKCHAGTIGNRVDVMSQFKGNSHHVQGVPVTNEQCRECHWESTTAGLIDNRYHEGYNYKLYSTSKNKKVDLVVYGAGARPLYYNSTTAVQFQASKMNGTDVAIERAESAKLNNHCLGCHSDQNNNTTPFNDCKTPRQYAWDKQSIAARYTKKGTTTWGKYAATPNAAPKNLTKAFSAHGNAAANQGGWDPTPTNYLTTYPFNNPGLDGNLTSYNTRAGFVNMSSQKQNQNVQCFDCHNSHGSKVSGVTSSYVNFSGTRNGGNLKETTAGKGGYAITYTAKANKVPGVKNPYNAGAGQCFDCHMTELKGDKTPWGYKSTYGATAPIKGYKDAYKFGNRTGAFYRLSMDLKNSIAVRGGHLQASSPLANAAQGTINGLCTPCHDPHGVSPSLGSNEAYAVPLLKGTWMTSPYKEDYPAPPPRGTTISQGPSGEPSWGQAYVYNPSVQPYAKYNIDRTTFGGTTRISEDDSKFAGLCLRCHLKTNLTTSTTAAFDKTKPFRGLDRVHQSVKGWGANTEHAFSCSKCHTPHQSGLPRLMQTNCLDYKHRGKLPSGGKPWTANKQDSRSIGQGGEWRGYPIANTFGNGVDPLTSCHVGAPTNDNPTWPDKNYWNNVTRW
jgi:predicted CxxxxCH...CXXCH cytochrome family protein